MGARLRIWWQKIKQHRVPILTTSILVVVMVLTIIEVRVNGAGFTGKTLWDWLQLLGVLAVPVVVGFGAVWFTTRQSSVAEAENKDNQREIALQNYIDKMSELILEKKLLDSAEEDKVRKIARVRTITVLAQLNARRIGYVFAFLREAGLMSTTPNSCVVSLKDANLRAVKWGQAELTSAILSGAILSDADLSGAFLSQADLSRVRLRDANLSGAHLSQINLSGAILIRADLSGANLSGASLSEANLSQADLHEADLTGANLNSATGITNEELEKQAKSLTGATMPDGLKHL